MKRALWFTGLLVLYVALFLIGAALFPVPAPPLPPEEANQALGAMGVCALIDTALLGAWAARTRLRGWRRWAALAGAFYGVKTFTSQLEALWFMPNVTGAMAPALFAMTLPLALVFPIAVSAAFGRRGPGPEPAWQAPDLPRGQIIAHWALLAAVVYPALFFLAGYFIAFRSPAVREFYGDALGDSFFSHMSAALAADPTLYPFEVFRGWLWIAMVLPLIRTSNGSRTADALWVGAFLALVQNDVHLLPNPLMTPEIRLYHFVETASSNFVWGAAIVALLRGRT